MNNIPRQKLCEIILRYGSSLSNEPQRCEGLLRDLCGEYRKEISALVSAVKEGITRELLSSENAISPEILLESLTETLQENSALSEEAAKWAVESWALALGVIDSHTLNEATVLQKTEVIPSPTLEDVLNEDTLNIRPQTEFPQSPTSNFWQIMTIAGSVIAIIIVGSLVYFQVQQQQVIEQNLAKLKEKEEQLRLKETTKREEAERQLLEEKRQREESERKLEAERLQREETERKLREEQRKKEEVNNFEVFNNINEGQAISLIENLYYNLSEKNFNAAVSLYSPQVAFQFNSNFFEKFTRVTVEDLRVTSRTENSLNLIGKNTYVWPDGSTQRELRSYTVMNLGGELKITSSEFIKVTKFRK